MAVRHVDAPDHLDDVAPAACNPNVEAGAIQETQSKKMVHTDLVPPNERRPYQGQEDAALDSACAIQWSRCSGGGVATAAGSHWTNTTSMQMEFSTSLWNWGGPAFFVDGELGELAEFAENTSWLTIAVEMQLATGVSLTISSAQQEVPGLLVAQARTKNREKSVNDKM